MNTAISVKEVTKKYKDQDQPAISNLSFQVNKGESIAFLGPNGCGKTTTIKMLVGLILQNEGQLKVLNLDPFKERRKLSEKISCVFGNRLDMWPEYKLYDNIKLQAALYNISSQELIQNRMQDCELFGLNHLLNKKPIHFSTGEKMRALLFLKMLNKPELLILDEPTLGMDIQFKEEIRKYLKMINFYKKTTILLTSHDMGDIEGVSNRVILINKGKKIIDEPIETLKKRPLRETLSIENYIPLEKIILSIYKDLQEGKIV